jgi:hypothetical protein
MELSSAVCEPDGGPRSAIPAVRLTVPDSKNFPAGTYTAVGVGAARAASQAAVKAIVLSAAPVASAPKSHTLNPRMVAVTGAAVSEVAPLMDVLLTDEPDWTPWPWVGAEPLASAELPAKAAVELSASLLPLLVVGWLAGRALTVGLTRPSCNLASRVSTTASELVTESDINARAASGTSEGPFRTIAAERFTYTWGPASQGKLACCRVLEEHRETSATHH